ncbi:tRNA pseudouridine synthase A [Telopea speciosissima]|uniref:tRNA pseudouridine synthase A n=1 Tax=Telopea speciosissima TaxID=54955 RepID=UPI001CC43234|nr:tRNA pseudouridine synthase A [Telopea speciosissima]
MDTSSSSPLQPPEPKKLKMSSTSDDDNDDTIPDSTCPSSIPPTEKKFRFKRRKIAIFLAYCGVGYQGMQRNPGAKTIEGDLEQALSVSGAISEADRGKPPRYDWARSARTDKGVSAVGQVVSGRFYIDPLGFVDRLNSNLSPQIRIFGFKRATASFNAKKFCDRRRYVYLIPVFALDPTSHPDRETVLASLGSENELAKCLECSDRGRKVVGLMGRRNSETRSPENGGNDVPDSEALMESRVSCGNGVSTVSLSEPLMESGFSSNNPNSVSVAENTVESVISSNDSVEPEEGALVCSDDKTAVPQSELTLEDKVSEDSGFCVSHSDIAEGPKTSTEKEKQEPDLVRCSNGEDTTEKVKAFCYDGKERERFNRILKHYEGTHNFHNFTTRTKAEDPSAQRFIVSFVANLVVNVEGIDFIKCEVVGQSFMLHQIRKMVGLAVAIMRNCAPESLLDTALQKDIRINVPTAPEVGLYLEECLFTSYNQKWKDSHEALNMEAYAAEAEEFKMKEIYPHIASTERKEGVVALWLHSLNHRNYPDLRFNGANETCTNRETTHVEQVI